MKKKNKGLWLFGLSGSGKTTLSKRISKYKKKSFIIDGDMVRDLISFDLRYRKSDRIIQNKRVLGIAKLVIKNGYYPIISSVYLDPKISKNAKQNGIKIINVVTTNKRVNRKLLNKKNVVGKSIIQPKINCKIINV